MAKRAFFLVVLETKTFLSSFKSGLGELDMDVYWRGGHSDRFLLQIWCPERPFSWIYGCTCLVWSSLIFLALWRWGSVGVLRLEWRRICGSCRFAPRSWSASVYSSKTNDYLGALWEIQRVNVATSLVKEWMIIMLTVFLHVLHCKISSVMPLESPTPELHFCWEGLSWPLSRALFTCGGIKLWTILN